LTTHAGDNSANTVKGLGTELRGLAKPQLGLERDYSAVTGFCSFLPVFNYPCLKEAVLRRPASDISKLIEQMEEWCKPSYRSFSCVKPLPKTEQLVERLLVGHYQKNASRK
jgi:hypothetical protein